MNGHLTMTQSFIKLGQFLKWQNIAQTGGEAKLLIQTGMVFVNGEPEMRRGRKLLSGDRVAVGDRVYIVQLSEAATESPLE